MLSALGAVVAKRVADAATQFPRGEFDVGWCVVLVGNDRGRWVPPTVVDEQFVTLLRSDLLGALNELGAAPQIGPVAPVAVAPQNLRAVTLDKIKHMRMQNLVDVRLIGIAIVGPIEQ